MDIIRIIRAELALRDWTVADLADKTGIAQSNLSRRMNGHIDFKVREIEAIAKAFELSLSELLGKSDSYSKEVLA